VLKPLALHHVQSQPASSRFLVFRAHIGAGLAHGLDRSIQRHPMLAVAANRQPRCRNCLDRRDGIALDSWNLDEPTDGIAGEPEIVLQTDLGGVLHLIRSAAKQFGEGSGRHCTGRSDLTLATDVSP
jgi:hypothetical protein